MIKLVFCLRRRADFSSEEFQRYWRDVHAPLVRKHKDVLRIKRYVQLHTDLGPLSERLRKSRGATEPYDGVAELWYESREALESLGRDAKARAAGRALLEDERRFIDLERSSIWVGSEIEVITS
jgi:uncharacterized protein (TIGR02118 family)